MRRRLIMYDDTTRDFTMYFDGQLVGYARSSREAEAVLDQFQMELLRAANDLRAA
jgi:hypothetical protein